MRKLRTMLATVATVTAMLVGGTTAANATGIESGKSKPNSSLTGVAAATDIDNLGCPSGDVCLISGSGAIIENEYYYYGIYNLHDKYNGYLVDNNQTGGAHVDLCYNYGGTNCFGGPAADYAAVYDLTPINSIKLRP